jgi:hypothetical protein
MTEFAWNETEGHDQKHESHSGESEPETGTMTLSVNEFSALEDRVLRAVEVVRRERHARVAAEERAHHAEAEMRDQSQLIEHAEKELTALRAEREQVRQRVERLLGQLDALEL